VNPTTSAPTSDAATLFVADGGVATITLNRPANRNALSEEMVASISASLQRAIEDSDVRVLVLTGVGTVFCAGADLKERTTVSVGAQLGGVPTFVRIFEQIQQSPKPVVAKLNGSALAGGLGLACSCDLVVAPNTAVFGFTEVRIGVAPAIISVVCLPKLRHADAAELFLTGERIGADDALRVGLINRSVAPEDVERVTNELIAKLLLGGPRALAATKAILANSGSYSDQRSAFASMAKLSGELFASPEATEGMTAFKEKRPAEWVPISRDI
jgi:methylglutaconyl-CoA hydratase